jgi:hypothetical protein
MPEFGSRRGAALPPTRPVLGPGNRALPGRWSQLGWARARTPRRAHDLSAASSPASCSSPRTPRPSARQCDSPASSARSRTHDPGRLSGPRPYRPGAPHALRFTQGAGMTPLHVRQRTAHPRGPVCPTGRAPPLSCARCHNRSAQCVSMAPLAASAPPPKPPAVEFVPNQSDGGTRQQSSDRPPARRPLFVLEAQEGRPGERVSSP